MAKHVQERRTKTPILSLISLVGFCLAYLSCAQWVFWLAAGGFENLDPEFNSMVNLAGQMSWLSIPGCIVSGSALVGCFVWRRRSDRLPPAFVLMNVIGLALSIAGTAWLARVHSFAPSLESDGTAVLGQR